MALKIAAYLRINRADLADQALTQLKKLDEENVLTGLASVWVQMYKSGLPSQIDKIFEDMQELGERHGGHTTKTKNILGLGLMQKGDYDRAMKVFEEAVNELQLDSEKGVEMLSKGENNDLSCLIVNYIKCNTMLNGQGQGMDFLKGDALNKTLFGYLVRMKSPNARAIFEER